MSRIIVKNLPKKVTEETLRETFSAKGCVTDVQLKYTAEGKFRGFGFIGFKTAEAADAAIEFFNGTYIGATKAVVEKCTALGSANKPRAWSKYAEGSSAHARLHGHAKGMAEQDRIKSKAGKGMATEDGCKDIGVAKNKFEEVRDDPAFKEFLSIHETGKRTIWADDAAETTCGAPRQPDCGVGECEQDPEPEPANADMDFIRSKIVKTKKEMKKEKTEPASGEESSAESDSEEAADQKANKPATKAVVRKFTLELTAKLSGLPSSAKKKDVRQFLAPLKPKSIRLPPRTKGIAFIGLQTDKELKMALNKHRTFLNGRRIDVKKHEERRAVRCDQLPPWHQQEQELANVEPVAETGRIFVRNLPYTATEDELEALFGKYGQLTEMTLPVDRCSRKIKGFAFVTFMLPECAQRAMSELDGSVFQGRMLHLLPGRLLRNDDEDGDQPSTDFKAKKEKQLKKQAGSAHNWNAMFFGANAVADLMAEKYNVDKSAVLDSSGQGSAAVRLALGETQLVSETRDFLEEHGVRLDAFSRPAVQRSKTVILAKNLPAHTAPAQLRDMFSRHGELGRVVLPPSGVTAVIEFFESSEARAAFRALAYTRFKNGPLYLEWAPADALGEPPAVQQDQTDDAEDDEKPAAKSTGSDQEEEDELKPEEGATLFVKNINFDTTDDDLREHFVGCGRLLSAVVSRKKDSKRPGQLLSQGYGFASFLRRKDAKKALKELQQVMLDGHSLQLKVSNRTSAPEVTSLRKRQDGGKQKSSKILVRNIPFQAKKTEVVELFKTFGELAAVRLPQKMSGLGTGPHRGFAFVEFSTRHDAKRAFAALCSSTHLYGRRLVLEWAAAEDDVDTLRLKTAAHFGGDAPSKKRVKMDDEGQS